MARPRRFSQQFSPAFGIGKYFYGLQQYAWDTSGPIPMWRLPASVVGAVDLRPIGAQAAAGGTPQGFAFVAAMQPVDVPLATALHFGQETATTAMRDAWEAEIGYRPNGDTVVDLLWDMLTTGADATGDAACKPLVPGVDGFFKLNLKGHSLVRQKAARGAPEMDKVLDLLRLEYRQLRTDSLDGRHRNRFGDIDSEHYRKVLGYWVRKYKLPYRAFQPSDLPDESDKPPETTLSDDFNRSDGEIGASWTEDGDIDIVTNAAQHVTSGSFGIATARYESDLSSDDHYAEITIANGGAGGDQQAAVTARHASAAHTYYYTTPYGSTQTLGKVVTGSFTSLDTESVTMANNDVYRVRPDGSEIKGYLNTVEKTTSTDTAITGNTRGGMWTYKGSGTAPRIDLWSAADLAAAAGIAGRLSLLGVGA